MKAPGTLPRARSTLRPDTAEPGRSGLTTASTVAVVTVLTSLPVFLPGAANGLICAEYGWSSARMGAVLAVYWLASLAGAYVTKHAAVPRVVERVLAVALGVTALGLACAAAAPMAGLWVSSALGGFVYGSTQPHTNALLMRRCPPRTRAFAFGLKQAAVPAATLLASASMPLLAQPAGWRPLFGLTAVLCAATTVPLLRRHERTGPGPGGPRRQHAPLRLDRYLTTLSCAGFLGAMVGNGLGGFLLLSLTSRGTSLAVASAVATAGAALNIAVRLCTGWLISRRPGAIRPALTALFLTGACGTALITGTHLALAATGALLAYGGGWGWAGLLHYVIGLPYPGQEQRATAYSQMGVSLGAAAGPLLCGALFTTAPQALWWALTTAGAGAAGCVLAARRGGVGGGT
ncbi:MFS transporter [Streptomyces collinus]|uniref:MFS transporter n=1 Tax=Streptomyces collinus TaxID=42684 RepID=UPI0036E8ADEC